MDLIFTLAGPFLLGCGLALHLVRNLRREGVQLASLLSLALALEFGGAVLLVAKVTILPLASPSREIVFSAPTHMYEGDIESAELVVDRFTAALFDELRELQAKDTPASGRMTETMPMEKSFPAIVATLEGIGFKILPAEPQKRVGDFKWRWQVQAERATIPSLDGENRLLSVRLEGQVGTGEKLKITSLKAPPPRRIHVSPRGISLFQQSLDWLKQSWDIIAWIFGGIATLVVLVRRWLKRTPPYYD
jgi:hypothetical protein